MCSCGSGITPLYSMGIAWAKDRQDRQDRQDRENHQTLHYLSSYRTREDAILRVPISERIKEQLYISDENTRLSPTTLIDYLTSIIEHLDETNRPEDIAVFMCGTPVYTQMVKDSCAIVSAGIKYYEW